MDIALVTPWMTRCGIATYSKALAEELANLDNRIYVVRLNRFGIKTVEYFETLATRRIPTVDILHVEHEYGLFSGGEGAFYSRLRAMHELLPIVTTMHTTGNPIPDQVVAQNSDELVVHNEYCKHRFGYDCHVIPHGVKPRECEDKIEAKKKLGIDPETPVVMLFGFISPYKGIESAIRTVGLEFPDVKLLVVGGWHTQIETNYMITLKRMSEQYAPNQALWLGWVPNKELPTMFGASDVCLYCNKFMSESGALLTMIGFGKCVLASNLPPNREKETKEALMCFENEGDLIRKLERLLTNPELRAKYEEGARNYAKEFSWEKIAEKHIKVYEDLL